jgi:hypothetical protein
VVEKGEEVNMLSRIGAHNGMKKMGVWRQLKQPFDTI